jgi:hypothetical protein
MLLKYDNTELQETLKDNKYHKKRGTQLNLRADKEYNSRAVF